MASLGKGGRDKGHAFERWLVKQFRKVMPGVEIHRGIQTRGAESADVVMPLLWVEAKAHTQKYSPRKALAQAIADAPWDKWPIAIIKDDRQPPFITMRLEDFMELWGLYWKECGAREDESHVVRGED